MVVVAPAVVCGSVMSRWMCACVCGGEGIGVCLDRLFMKTIHCIAMSPCNYGDTDNVCHQPSVSL